ncbi:MAG: hypothetical protein SV377_01045 [Halobacteria archaeon]|nr:hypothetical protein [Halobacteria archaeon]
MTEISCETGEMEDTDRLDELADKLDLPCSTRQVAKSIRSRVKEENLHLGRDSEKVNAAILYVSCRYEGVPRSRNKIAEISDTTRRDINHISKDFVRSLDLELDPPDPYSYVSRYCNELDLSENVEETAHRIIDKSLGKGMYSGKAPTSFAAAAVYASSVASGERRTQKEIARVSSVSTVTIRKLYRDLLNLVE